MNEKHISKIVKATLYLSHIDSTEQCIPEWAINGAIIAFDLTREECQAIRNALQSP